MPVAPVPINLPLTVTQSGAQPTAPATLRATLVSIVSAVTPGFTADLPGSLVEDIVSTDTLALVLIDGARVETVNSLTSYGANEFLLNQLGQQAGIMLGRPTNTSVNVVLSATQNGDPCAGFAIPTGFVVSDGTHQYVVLAPGGVTEDDGSTEPLSCVAINPGAWPVPANIVDQTITSVPSPFAVTCNNPVAGLPGQLSPESFSSYRTRVLEANQAPALGMPSQVRTNLGAVPSVVYRTISIQTLSAGRWTVLVAGGNEYAMAKALYDSVLDVSTLVGSVNVVSGITKANPGKVTTSLFHGLITGATAVIADSNPSDYNGTYTITVIDDYNFTIGVDTTGFATYVASAIVTPNPRNVTVTILDPPDTYQVNFANPLSQIVTGTVTWNTSLANFTQDAAVNQAAVPALVAYVNALLCGQQMNEFEFIATFQAAVANVLPAQYLTRLVFAIDVDGVGVSVESGTGIYPSDTQSILTAAINAFVVGRG